MSEYISLPRKYRPQKLDDQVGQDNIVKMIYNSIEMNRLSHAMVFVGPAGTGKTSLARALSKTLNCKADVKPCCKCSICETIANGKNLDVLEMNAADKRGIDDMRDVLSKIRFKPMSKYKIIILDECFYKDSLVTMSDFSKKKICDIKVGDTIINSNGIDIVEKVIVNKIPLERLVVLKLNNGTEILTTVDHKFYTDNGWVECHKLKGGDLLYDYEKMCNMWENVSNWKQKSDDLFSRMWKCSEKENNENESYCSKTTQSENNVSYMQKDIFGVSLHEKKWCEILFIRMCKYWTYWKQKNRRNKKENIRKSQTMESNKARKNTRKKEFNSYAEKQSNDVSRKHRQSDANKNEERNFELAWFKRWKRRIYRPTMETMCGFNSCNKNRSSFRICNRLGKKARWLSNKLQSRFSLSQSETCNRSGWGISQLRMGQSKRLKEKRKVGNIRVESITFYEQGDRREYFERYLSDKERTCGYIEMYDLTIKEKHNYMINDVLVHNCHMLSNDSWNVLLKDLEEPPEYAMFVLCTTNPEKIPETILSRCQIYEFHSIKQNDIANRLRYICEQEGFDYENDAMDVIAKHSKGGMRDAISSLEQVACFSNGNITKQDTIDSLGIISDDCFIEIANCLYAGDIDGAIEVLDSLVDKNKPLLSIFYQLQELYGDEQKAFFRKTKENLLGYGRNSLLEITKLFIEYEAKMKYSNDKYFILTSLFYDISHIGNGGISKSAIQDVDIEKRILALEDALKNGKLQNFEKIGNIQRALNGKKAFPTKDERRKEDAKPKQVDDIVSEFASLSKGEIL